MKSPLDRNLDHSLAARLLGWQRQSDGWLTARGDHITAFQPSCNRDDAMKVVRRMVELNYSFEERPVDCVSTGGAVLVSFYRGGEVYSALGREVCEAICVAADRFLNRGDRFQPRRSEGPERGEAHVATGFAGTRWTGPVKRP